MTRTESPSLPASARQSGTQAVTRAPARAGQGDSYLLRLCLDLQLDAAMLTLGAAARDTIVRDGHRDGGSVIPRPAAPASSVFGDLPIPWRRWLNEDVDQICTLAASLPEGPPVLPAGRDSGFAEGRARRVLAELRERYEAIREVLAEVLSQPGPDGDGDTWQPRIRDAQAHCQARLRELTEFGGPAPAPAPVPVRFRPGELLG